MRLVHEAKMPQSHAKNDFLAIGAAALLVASAFGCSTMRAVRGGEYYGLYINSVNRVYGMPRTRQMRIGGQDVSVMFLSESISQLSAAMGNYRILEDTEGGTHTTLVVLSKVRLGSEYDRLMHSETRLSGNIGFGFSIGNDGQSSAMVAFPSQLERNPLPGAVAGRRIIDANNFANLYKAVTGSELRRVKMVVDQVGVYITVHAVPVDSQGRFSGRTSGGTLAYGITYYPGTREVRGGIGLLIEPGGRDPVNGAEGPY